MSQNNEHIIHPKLLLQFYKDQTVPKLVSKHDRYSISPFHYQRPPKSKQKKQKSIHSVNSMYSKRTVENKNPQLQLQDINRLLQGQRLQNSQLRQIIKQLTIKGDRLKQINEDLLIRIKQVQNVYQQFTRNYEYQKRQQQNRIKIKIYQDIENYFKKIIQKFTQSLSHDRMSPIVQRKIQNFLQEILQINSISVQNQQKKIKIQSINIDHNQVNQTINSMLAPQSRTRYKMGQSRLEKLQKSNYINIFRQLQKIDKNPSKSQINSQQQNYIFQQRSKSGEKAIPTKIYGTPQRTNQRPKIFKNKYITQIKNKGVFHTDLQL